MLDLWIAKAMNDQILVTGDVLRAKWTQFADMVGVPDDERLDLSEGWLCRLKKRHGLRNIKRHGEAGSVGERVVETEHECLKELIEAKGYR